MRVSSISNKLLTEKEKRFDGEYYLNDNSYLSRRVENTYPETVGLSDIAKVFNPPVFKRQFCLESSKSVQYFQSSDVPSAIEKSPVFVFKGQAQDLNLLVEKGDILITGFGSIGNTRIVSERLHGACYANIVCRVKGKDEDKLGVTYAFLASKYGRAQLNKNASGSVVRYIEAPGIKKTRIPVFSSKINEDVNILMESAQRLRSEASNLHEAALQLFSSVSGLGDISVDEYDYYGSHSCNREPSTFKVSVRNISSVSINAFNYSSRISSLKKRICSAVATLPLCECISEEGLFSTGSFPRVELNSSKGIELINQRDIFDSIVKGKFISKRGVKVSNLLEKDEVIIAGVGTLGESETFCRCVYSNSYLKGKLISGEFIRMKSNGTIPSGYLFLWLSSEYGFRLIRNTQSGTKLCRPIPALLEQIPVPVINQSDMCKIDSLVKESQEKYAQASIAELQAIALVEAEVDRLTEKQ